MNLRSFCMYALTPQPGLLGCVWSSFNPGSVREHAQSRGMSPNRGFFFPIAQHALWYVVMVAFTSTYIGEAREFMGFIFIYGVGQTLLIVIGNAFHQRLMPPLDKMYGLESGPPSFGLAMMGFFVIVSGYSIAQRHLGAWFAVMMPLILFLYEGFGSVMVGTFFVKEFVMQGQRLHEMYAGSHQEILPSCVIALLHFHAQAARLTIFISEVANDPDSHSWMLTLIVMLVVNVMARTLWPHKLICKLTMGRKKVDNFTRLLCQTKFQGGYPALMACVPIGLARMALGNPAIPNEAVGWLLLCVLAETLLEDGICRALELLHLVAPFSVEPPSEAELKQRAAKRIARKAVGDGKNNFNSVAPEVTPDQAESEEAARLEFLADDLVNNLSYEFGELPFWAHFTASMVAQFHMVLLVIVFAGGLNYTLGFCNEAGYTGVGRAVVWWPKMDPADPCGGEH